MGGNRNMCQATPNVVEVSALSKRVDIGGEPLTILHENSFVVATGETVAILGASGSGKSTLLGLMAGLDLPSSGSVMLAGEKLVDLDEDARAVLRGRFLGFVFQSFQLLPSLNAIENVMLPLELAGATQGKSIDGLVTAGLAERELKLQPVAAPTTLVRRMAFDLTGLPPSPEVVAAFEKAYAADAAGAVRFFKINKLMLTK